MKQLNRTRLSLFACLTAISLAVAGCAGIGQAFRAADTLDEQAYVVAELYSIVLQEAAEIAADPTTPDVVVIQMRNARNRATPVILELRAMSDAFVSLRTAENEVALQEAVSRAALVVAEFLDVVRGSRS